MTLPQDTSLGGRGGSFPSTRWSTILAARDPASPACRRALEELCRRYWKPIYVYVRAVRGFSNEEAKDLTQEFLLEAIEGNLLERYSADRGSFRTYLRGALRLFLLEQHRKTGSLRRGGDRRRFALRDEEAKSMEKLLRAPGLDPEQVFDEQWVSSVIDAALQDLFEELERDGKERQFRLFDRYELHPPPGESLSYPQIGEIFGMTESEVNHALTTCRRILRERIRDRIRDYVGIESEVEEEIRRFFER